MSGVEDDLVFLVDELERMIVNAGRVPLTGKVWLAEDEVFAVIDRLRQAIPEALRQAQKVNRDRERLLQEAREEGEALVQEARAYAERLVQETSITQRAREEAEQIIEEARKVSREIRVGARDYADDLLAKVENTMQRAQHVIEQARAELGPRRSEAADPNGAAASKALNASGNRTTEPPAKVQRPGQTPRAPR